jgi:hypothetical protein
MHKLTLEDFTRSFGTTIEHISGDCQELINKTDFGFRILRGKERDTILLDVLKKIEYDQQIISAPGRQIVWEKGWEENLLDFVQSNYNLDKLLPKFIRPAQVIRLAQNYIKPSNPNFELDYFSVFRCWLFDKYFKEFGTIYEFGCGTGFNLVELARHYPEKKLYGLDYANSSVNLVNEIGKAYGWKMTGHIFNMVSPEKEIEIENNSAIFTICAIEQLASNFEDFLQYLLSYSPGLCVHVEPIIELYDENDLVDYVAIKFHKKRGYTEGFLTRLKELEIENKIEILKVKRLFFGSLYHEGYTYLV